MYSSKDAPATLLKSRHRGNTGALWWFSLFLPGSGSEKSLCWLSPDTYFLKKIKRTVLAGGIRNWDQHTGLVSSGVSSCISLLFAGVWDPKDISWDLLGVGMGRSCRWNIGVNVCRNWAPVLPPTNLPSKLSYREWLWRLGLARVGMCCVKRGQWEFGVHREGQGCPGSTSTQVNGTFLSYRWVEMSWDLGCCSILHWGAV